MLLFRDWLRTNDADRELYASAKRELAARDWKYVQQYADAKTDGRGGDPLTRRSGKKCLTRTGSANARDPSRSPPLTDTRVARQSRAALPAGSPQRAVPVRSALGTRDLDRYDSGSDPSKPSWATPTSCTPDLSSSTSSVASVRNSSTMRPSLKAPGSPV